MEQNNEVVVDRAKSQWSDLWKKEDYWAIWIGFFFLIVAAWLCFGQRPALEAKFNEYETIIKAEERQALQDHRMVQGHCRPEKRAGPEAVPGG